MSVEAKNLGLKVDMPTTKINNFELNFDIQQISTFNSSKNFYILVLFIVQIKGCRLCKDNTKDGVSELTEYDALTETTQDD